MNRARPTPPLGEIIPAAACVLLAGLLLAPTGARAEGERVVRLELCRSAEAHEGSGCGTRFPSDVRQVHVLLAVAVPPEGSGAVTAVWRFEGRVAQRQVLAIPFYRPGGYRTRARQRIPASRAGAWSVEILDSAGRRLVTERFSVGGAAAPAPTQPDPVPESPDVAAQPDPVDAAAQPDPVDAGQPAATDGAVADAWALAPLDGGAPDAAAAAAPAAPAAAAAAPVAAPTASEAAPPPSPSVEPAVEDGRRTGGVLLLAGGLLLLIAGVLIARRRAGRAARAAAEATAAPDPPPAAASAPAPKASAPDAAPIVAPPPGGDGGTAATDALQRLTDLVTRLWGRWVTATGGSPQRAINAAWRTVPDGARVGLDHIRLCNALEAAARTSASIPPRGDSVDILRVRLHGQAPALVGIVCALAVEAERLDLPGLGLDDAFAPWGGRTGLTAELLRVLDDGAAAVGTRRLNALPYETKATTVSRDFDAELRPFPVPTAIAERLGAGNRIVRVESPPFADAGPLVVWGINPS